MNDKYTYLEGKIQMEQKVFEANLAMKEKRNERRLKQKKGKEVGRWSLKEHAKYYTFLVVNENILKNRNMHKNDRVFRLMSRFVMSRTSEQCRSHHQKIVRKWADIQTIIHNLTEQMASINIKSVLEENSSSLIPMSQEDVLQNSESWNNFSGDQSNQTSKEIQKQLFGEKEILINNEFQEQIELPLIQQTFVNLTIDYEDMFKQF